MKKKSTKIRATELQLGLPTRKMQLTPGPTINPNDNLIPSRQPVRPPKSIRQSDCSAVAHPGECAASSYKDRFSSENVQLREQTEADGSHQLPLKNQKTQRRPNRNIQDNGIRKRFGQKSVFSSSQPVVMVFVSVVTAWKVQFQDVLISGNIHLATE